MPEVVGLIGVYDADGTVLGELSYFVRSRLGRAHCALCDITHGRVRERADWRASRDALPVPFLTYHRDDQPDDVRIATRSSGWSSGPVVVAETASGELVPLLDGPELASLHGSPERLVDAIEHAVNRHNLSWQTAGEPTP